MAAESGRLLAGHGKRSKGRNEFHPSPNQIGIIHYCAAMGCTGAVSKSLLASPICKLHDCLRWWLFLTEWICERGSCLSCYQCTFNSVSSFSCLRLFLSPSLTLPLLPLVCGLSPSRLGHLVCLGHLRFKAS